jgi:hypothetical protein
VKAYQLQDFHTQIPWAMLPILARPSAAPLVINLQYIQAFTAFSLISSVNTNLKLKLPTNKSSLAMKL